MSWPVFAGKPCKNSYGSQWGDPAMAQSSYEQGLELVEQQIIHCTNGHQKKDARVRQFGLVTSSWCILIENDEIADSLLLTLTVKMLHSCRCRSPKKSTKKGENFCRNWRSLKSAWSSTGPGWLKVIPRDRRLLRQCLSTSQCRRTAVIPNLLVKNNIWNVFDGFVLEETSTWAPPEIEYIRWKLMVGRWNFLLELCLFRGNVNFQGCNI